MMKIYATRDSVAAGDDTEAPHCWEFSFSEDVTLQDALERVQSEYLPSIYGGSACWSVTSNIPVAVLAQQWKAAKMLLFLPGELRKLDSDDGVIRVHFNYHAQLDPETVFQVLRRLRLKAF